MNQQDLFSDIGPRTPTEPPSRKKPPCTPAPIGSGPAGETCKTCKHSGYVQMANRYYKCGLMRKKWTNGPGSDIRLRWAACEKWEAIESKVSCVD